MYTYILDYAYAISPTTSYSYAFAITYGILNICQKYNRKRENGQSPFNTTCTYICAFISAIE